MARPVGANKEYTIAKKTVEQMLNLEKWVNDHFDDAQKILADIMLDPEASHSVRKGVAETIVGLHKEFYKRRKGLADSTIEEMEAEITQEERKDKPLICLTMNGGS